MYAVKAARGTRGLLLSEDSFDYGVMQQMCQRCVDAARRLIETVFEHLATPYRSAGWHAVYCKADPKSHSSQEGNAS